ncbi:MAG: putative bifunctional diguanylate cyclase/phosphodiesterase, partial [Thiohalomonadales bacterium]
LLPHHDVVRKSQFLLDTAKSLNNAIAELETEALELLSILEKVETRFPAAPILLEKLQPNNAEIKAAIEQAILEGRDLHNEPKQTEILAHLRELRYVWAQQIGAVRVYVANRSGIFGQPAKGMQENDKNRRLYVERVQEILAELLKYDKKELLGFQQSTAVHQIIASTKRYERDFKQAAVIYASDNWRADVPFFSHRIRPAFANIWNWVNQFEKGLDGLSEENINKQMQISDYLSEIILIFATFIVLSLLAVFLILEFIIRRPIVEISKALTAEAKEKTYKPVLTKYQTQETQVLVASFHDMQEQVRSRQTRLQSILDNAGEGIITIDAEGVIETFNCAAQLLFGYSSDEAIGSHSREIIRLSESRMHADFFDFCLSPISKNQINEVVVSAVHRDGNGFPISINTNDLWVNGKQLFIAIVQDISERVALMENLRTMAEHDSLTGLYNREYFMTELDRVVENIKRGVRGDFALLYIDLDNFKFVNDTLGHMAGDQLLVEVTRMFTHRNRKSDLLARLGGDEFAILIYGAKRTQVIAAAEAHRKLLSDYVFKYDGKVVNIGCTIGLSLFGQETLPKEDLLAQADIACHIAKRSGRNRIHVYESDDRRSVTEMSEDMGWATLIKNAIDNDKFVLLGQPIAETMTNYIDRYEILLRMRGDDGKDILPAGFLPAAERFGFIRSIDRWVVRRAIAMLAKMRAQNPNCHFAINLSAKSLDDRTMFNTITSALEQHGVKPTAVTFEITENVAIANMSSAVEFLKRLRILGCKTALDDFGVGYSSFAYLKDLPVDFVKIDGSFVRNISTETLQYTMVRSMHDVAHAMGKQTVAEYVDSQESLDKLKQIGVDFVQGFYIGKPRILSPLYQEKKSRIALVSV